MNEPQKETAAAPTQAESQALQVMSRSELSVNGAFETGHSFTHAQRIAKMLVNSSLVPEHFRGEAHLGDAVLVLDIALRLKMNPLLVMQQCYIVKGKAGWSAQFVLGTLNTSKRFETVRFDRQDLGTKDVAYSYIEYVNGQKTTRKGVEKIHDYQVIAWSTERGSKLPADCGTLAKARELGLPILEGPPASIEMAVLDGWFHRSGSKWQTMPWVMLNYRAATFFGRLYAPELQMGLPTVEELEDTLPEPQPMSRPIFRSAATAAEVKAALADSPVADQTPEPKPTPTPAPDAPEPKQSEPQPPGELPLETPTPAPKPEKPQSEQQRYAKAVRNLCASASPRILESTLLGFCVEVGISDGSAPEIDALPPEALKQVHDNWAGIAKRIYDAQKAGPQ
jgi:hypothetical protein